MSSKAATFLDGLTETDAKLLAGRIRREQLTGAEALAEAWLLGATAVVNVLAGRRTCRVCGCHDHAACEGGCSWVEADLCSTCKFSGAN